jgi:hypothetical protein
MPASAGMTANLVHLAILQKSIISIKQVFKNASALPNAEASTVNIKILLPNPDLVYQAASLCLFQPW